MSKGWQGKSSHPWQREPLGEVKGMPGARGWQQTILPKDSAQRHHITRLTGGGNETGTALNAT